MIRNNFVRFYVVTNNNFTVNIACKVPRFFSLTYVQQIEIISRVYPFKQICECICFFSYTIMMNGLQNFMKACLFV